MERGAANATDTRERILLAVDESDATDRALRYVAHVVDGRPGTRIDLYHRLPALPPELREHGGSEEPERETELGQELTRRIAEWVSGLETDLLPNLEAFKNNLMEYGVSPDSIEFCIDEDVFPGESLADALRRVAGERGCHTIAVSREHLPGIQDFFKRHTADRLVRGGEGFAVWVVE